jgi:EpsD family peptidyl-prolyl cis-trans isomerase
MSYLSSAARAISSSMVLLSALLLTGCGGEAQRKSDSQVAATVNDGELTVHQIETVLERQPRLATGDGGGAARVLEGLIDQELAAQAARSANLDKDPRVVQRLEAARREILAQAWQESVATKARGATSDEIDRYYDAQPALFAQRRIYVVRETGLQAEATELKAFIGKVAALRSPEELTLLMQRDGLSGPTRVVAQAAEDLPLNLLAQLAPLEPGRSIAFAQGGNARVYTLLQAVQAPVDRRQAQGAIAAYMANQRKSEAISDAMKKLRSEARIAYQGSFAASAPTAAATAASAAR